jgi:hypothetical protein
MAINKVGSKGIEDGSVATADFAPGTVSSDKLQDNAVTNAKLTNTTVTLAGQSITLGASTTLANKFVDWQSVTTADGSTFNTAVSGQGYFIDTTSAAHTITLPASASIGDFIAIKDYAGTFATNNLTIARNGHNIQGAANDSLISTNRASLVLVYVDSTKGWLYWEEHNVGDLGTPLFTSATGGTITQSGDYQIHTFTGDGCFVVTSAGNQSNFPACSPQYASSGPNTVSYLIVAGGGGAKGNSYRAPADGQTRSAAGGGAGGFREGRDITPSYTASPLVAPSGLTITAQTYPVTVGAGGTGGGPVTCGVGGGSTDQTQGSDSIFSTITSAGGGKGGSRTTCGNPFNPGTPFPEQGFIGGSGGGAGTSSPTDGPGQGANGNTPPVSPPQGNPGGNGSHFPYREGGGGGAGATGGGPPAGQDTAPGGNGVSTSITGSPITYAGGGGAANAAGGTSNYLGTGGSGGGGSASATTNGGSGSANTGGGGGGSKKSPCGAGTGVGGSGGKGIVVIRYKFQ